MNSNLENMRLVIADTDALKNAVYRLRYEVYVNECGFESPNDHPGGLEKDSYEDVSTHLAVVEDIGNGKHRVIGTTRMVHSKGFPLEEAVPEVFCNFENNFSKPPAMTTIEISRMAVLKRYRRRISDGLLGVESYIRVKDGKQEWIDDERRKRPYVIMGLYQSVVQFTKQNNITHWYMLSERALKYVLGKFGYIFHKIGEGIEYHGRKRIPYLADFSEIDENIKTNHPKYFDELNNAPALGKESENYLGLTEEQYIVD